jgi:hypothetical protein
LLNISILRKCFELDRKNNLTKILAIIGTILTWIPILLTIITSIIGTIARRTFLFDFLMPAELFPFALVGSLLLLWASWRARSHRRPIGWGLFAMVVFLFGGQAIAVVTGLASGATPPTGWPFALTISSIVLYSLSLIEVCVTGILLVKRIYSMK